MKRKPFPLGCPLALASCFCATIVGVGCAPGDSEGWHVYDTEEAEVRSPIQLCPAQLKYLDDNIRRVETALDAASDELVQIEVAGGLPVAACDAGAYGCYLPDVAEVHGFWSALDHEIVHAVASRVGGPELFWAEGLAEALRGARTERGTDSVLESVDGFEETQAYRTAGHFVRWLSETYGLDPIRALARDARFEEAVGMSLEEAVTAYEAEAPWSYAGDPSRCDFRPLEVDGVSTTVEEIGIACDDLSSTYYLFGATDRTFVLDAPGLFEMRLAGGEDGAFVYMFPCQEGTLDEPPPDEYLGDVVREEFLGAAPTWFQSNTVHTVRLEPAKYRVIFDDDQSHDEPLAQATLTFELRRIAD